MKITKIIIISLFVYSCSVNKRLQRMAENHPELFKVDTLWKYDTVRVYGSRVDTFLQAGVTSDTVFITKDNQVIKYFNNGKTVYLEGIVKTVDRIIKYPVRVQSPIITKTIHKSPWWHYLVLIALLAIILAQAFRK